jgi:hypothetical protein
MNALFVAKWLINTKNGKKWKIRKEKEAKKEEKRTEKRRGKPKSGQDRCKLLAVRAAARLCNANSVLAVHKRACPHRLLEGRQCRALAFSLLQAALILGRFNPFS